MFRRKKRTSAFGVFTSVPKSSGQEEGEQREAKAKDKEGKIGKGMLKANLFKYTLHLSKNCCFWGVHFLTHRDAAASPKGQRLSSPKRYL